MRKLIKYPNSLLEQKCQDVTVFDEHLNDLLKDMHILMALEKGIGIAAPQVGELFNVMLVSEDGKRENVIEMINPKILHKDGQISFNEACLSFPNLKIPVTRSRYLTLEYQDRTGKKETCQTSGLLAVVIQHEYEHLLGVTLANYLSSEARRFLRKSLSK